MNIFARGAKDEQQSPDDNQISQKLSKRVNRENRLPYGQVPKAGEKVSTLTVSFPSLCSIMQLGTLATLQQWMHHFLDEL